MPARFITLSLCCLVGIFLAGCGNTSPETADTGHDDHAGHSEHDDHGEAGHADEHHHADTFAGAVEELFGVPTVFDGNAGQ